MKAERTNNFYRSFFEYSMEAVFLTAPDGAIFAANPAACQMFGHTEEEICLLGRTGLVDSTSPQLAALLAERVSTGKACGELIYIHSDGTRFPGTVSTNQFFDECGNVRTILIISDLTEKKQAELKRSESEERYRSVVSAMAEGVVFQSANGSIIDVNPAAERIMGTPMRELIGRTSDNPMWEAIHEDGTLFSGNDHPSMVTLRTGKPQSNVVMGIKIPDGTRRWISINSEPVIAYADSKPHAVVTTFTDITLRKLSEKALQESEGRFKVALKNSPVAVFEQDINLRYVWIYNPKLGYDIQQVIGLTDAEIMDPYCIPAIEAIKYKVIQTGKPARQELAAAAPGSPLEYYDLYVEPMRDETGQVIGVICAATDITHRKQYEAALAESEERFRGAFETAALGMALLSLDGKFVKVNNALCAMLGYEKSELLTTDFQTITHPEDLPADLKYQHQLIDGQIGSFHTEKRYFHKNGDTVWILLSVSIVRTSEGNPIHFVAQIQNITERKLAEEVVQKNEANLSAMLDNSPYLTWLKDAEGRYIRINQVFANYVRLEDINQAIGKTDLDLNPKELAEKYRTDDAEVMASRKQKHVEELAFDGKEIRWIETYKTPVIDAQGNILGTVGFAQDISERKQIEAELRISAVAFETQEAMMITDPNGVIMRVNKAFTESTGYSYEEAIGNKPSMLKSGRHDAEFYHSMWECIHHTGSWQGEIWDRRKNGEVYPKWLTISAVKDPDGVVTHYVGSHFDITERKAAEDKIHHLAYFDPLTRLPNRRLLQDRLHQAVSSCGRSGQSCALLFIDLDNFKTINDTLGHDLGDLLLSQVALRLNLCVRDSDSVARLGGDEFVVLLEGLSPSDIEAAEQAEAVGDKILSSLNQPYQLGSHEHHSSCSIGVALFKDAEQGVDELLKQADIAMYQAKKAGRNTLRFFDPRMQEMVSARALLESDLRRAIDRKQLQLYYQIQVDSSSRPIGAEALIRWIHPERDMVSPAHFIPLAEETGLILPIGLWVLETACAQLKVWELDALTRELILSVNVSVKQFRQPGFASQVEEVVQRYGINPDRLKLEVTESMLLDDIETMIATMSAINEIGIRFSLDDFGTGYSSLQYLKRLPLNQLKIDQSFVRDLVEDDSDKAIVRTIIAMAHSMKLNVIAEGVETEEQRHLLLNKGCTHYQGYLFGRPMAIDQFQMLLRQD